MNYKSLHFVGIGGSGMSALAQTVRAQGSKVSGSDRSFDRHPGTFENIIEIFKKQGISITAQDGTGVSGDISAVVVSTAVEETNPEIITARRLAIPIITRAQLLASIVNEKYGIAVGGTSGKSTVAAMIAYILFENKLDPFYIGGGIITNFQSSPERISNTLIGGSDIICVETDESDGSIVLYSPKISVLTNISKDHKEIPELVNLFSQFINNTSETVVLNSDCPLTMKLKPSTARTVTYGIASEADFKAVNITLHSTGSTFSVNSVPFRLTILGIHNISNALAAAAVCSILKLPLDKISASLSNFKGIKRRLELIGRSNGISVYDDYSHNPVKVSAAISALKSHCDRIIVVYQPHGFGPTNLMKNEFIDAFAGQLSQKDMLFILDIFDAGGTANRTVSSSDLVNRIKDRKILARHIPTKEELREVLKKIAQPGDTILVMGARDNTLTQFCEELVKTLA